MMPAHAAEPEQPAEFRRALAGIHTADIRPEISIEPTPGPRRLAPYGAGFAARVAGRPGHDDEDGTGGRLIVLHDPDGQSGWHGTFRLVAYVRSAMEPEIATDPLLGQVGWSWLTDALAARGAGYANLGGTVTRAISESFGDKAGEDPVVDVELRASWSPTVTVELSAHVLAWSDVLGSAAGLPPSGTTAIGR